MGGVEYDQTGDRGIYSPMGEEGRVVDSPDIPTNQRFGFAVEPKDKVRGCEDFNQSQVNRICRNITPISLPYCGDIAFPMKKTLARKGDCHSAKPITLVRMQTYRYISPIWDSHI